MNTDTLEAWAPRVLSILRIVAALLFFEHGTTKLLGFPPSDHSPEVLSLSWIAGALELVGGALLIVGLFTRPVAFILSGEMAFAYWMAHAPRSAFPLVNDCKDESGPNSGESAPSYRLSRQARRHRAGKRCQILRTRSALCTASS